MAASAVLARYRRSLAALRSPRFLTFSFSIEQVGARLLSQTHRVYRDGPNERDETLSVDGRALPRPDVRIFRNRSYRYDLAAVAPRLEAYDFKLTGMQHDGDHDDYAFATTAHGSPRFAVTSVVIDGARFLPLELNFHVDAGALRGEGRLVYARSEAYWLVREAEVSAHDARGLTSRERIVWTGYQYPDSLPPSTFSARTPGDGLELAPRTPRPAEASAAPPQISPPVAPERPAGATAPERPPAVSRPPAVRPSAAPAPARTRAPHALEGAARPPRPSGTAQLLPGPVTPAPLQSTPEPLLTAAPASQPTSALPGAGGPP